MNSAEVQNLQRKLDDKYLCLFCLCKVCSCVSEATRFADFVSNSSSSDTKAFILHSQVPQKQYIVHCMHYGITL